jgi:hypothetical protein
LKEHKLLAILYAPHPKTVTPKKEISETLTKNWNPQKYNFQKLSQKYDC